MGANSHIEWTQATWNPVTGCNKISAGCKNCYAARMALRLQAMGSSRYSKGFDLTLHDDVIDLPKTWKKGKTIFVNSMSDLFYQDVPFEYIQRVFQTMSDCPQHIFQVLTKRSDRLKEIAGQLVWPENVWMGVSVENSGVFQRIDDLRAVPAAVRFLSCEPLIGPLEGIDVTSIHWVIVGGESGPDARKMKVEWVDSIFQACRQQKVPFFFKQWGGVRKKLTGRLLNGRTYDEMPESAGKTFKP